MQLQGNSRWIPSQSHAVGSTELKRRVPLGQLGRRIVSYQQTQPPSDLATNASFTRLAPSSSTAAMSDKIPANLAAACRERGFSNRRPIPKRGLIKSRIAAFAVHLVAAALGRVGAHSLIANSLHRSPKA